MPAIASSLESKANSYYLTINYAMDKVCQTFVNTKVLLKHSILSDNLEDVFIIN